MSLDIRKTSIKKPISFGYHKNPYSQDTFIAERVKHRKFLAKRISKETDPETIAAYRKGIEDVKRKRAEAAAKEESQNTRQRRKP
eukprot:scaffold90928_cov36-Cyclotella_meneghiniana.AAC.4